MNSSSPPLSTARLKNPVVKALLYLMISALLFSITGICVRYASATMDNYAIVFFRNAVGLFIFIPMLIKQGMSFLKTKKLWMHTWRSVVGLGAMYGFFYAIAHLKLSNAMVFNYSSPIFIPIIAWLFLKEKITGTMIVAALIGLIGVLFVAKPDSGLFDINSIVGVAACIMSALAFVTVRALTNTEPPTRVVFYFCVFGTLLSGIPMFWHGRLYTWHELMLVFCAGMLANISQLFMSYAYSLAPASQIGPMNYIAIIFAGIWGYLFWQEIPDMYALIGFGIIILAIVLCNPLLLGKLKDKFLSN